VKSLIENKNKIMVSLDSDHSKEHVLKELEIYSKFVTKGCYLVLEDTNINGHPVYPDFGPGPMEALNEFLDHNKEFIADKNREKFYLTFNPRGFLRKIK
jgi:cephalosporin hydroxylase